MLYRENKMRKFLTLIFTLMLIACIPFKVKAAGRQSEPAVVHTVLFWSNGCPHCNQVLADVLPPLQDKYNSQLSVMLIELVTLEDIDNLYNLGTSLGLSKEQVAVPFLLIDHVALIGADEIQSKLSGLIEKYLSSGGLEYPDIPQLDEILPDGITFTSSPANLQLIQQSTAGTQATGMAMAWGVMAFMGIALILAIATILRAFQGKPLRDHREWLDFAIPVLSILGLGASIYLTYVEFTHTRALCGPVGDCNAVQSSPYAKLFGIIPIGLAGAFGCIALLVTWLWQRFRSDPFARIAGPAMFGMALFGTLFSIYLTYLELFVIHAVCIWCLSSAVIITALMLLNLPPITQWLAVSDEEE